MLGPMASSQSLTNPPPAGLIVWWVFDEGSGTTVEDASGNGNSGTLQGDPPPTWANGVTSGALTFDGSQNYVQSDQAFNQTISAFTIEAWFAATSVSGENPAIVSTLGDDIGYNYLADIVIYTNSVFNGNSIGLNTRWDMLFAPLGLVDGNWHHVAGTWDGTNSSLYVDGQLVATQPDAYPAFTWTTPLRLAYRDTNGGCNYGGEIGEVRIYDQALSSNEVLAAYNTATIGDGGLVASNGDCQCTNSPVQSIFPPGIFVVAIAAGSMHSVALDAFGNVWTWGLGDSGRLGNGQNTNIATPVQLTGISNVIAVAAGYDHTMALTADRTVWTWGSNGSGQLGEPGGGTNAPGQVPPSSLSNVVAIAAGKWFSLAVSNGHVYAWGDNTYPGGPVSGQLGTSNVTSSMIPLRVSGISNVLLVAAGATGYHSFAMTVDGGTNHYWGWGDNYFGEVGNGTNDTISDGTNDYQYVPAQAQFCTRCQRCVQLGTGGVFTAQCSGTLYLYFNGQITDFAGSSGSYTVTVNNVTNTAVPATSGENLENGGTRNGVSFGTVTNGGIYSYSATGYCVDALGNLVNANGMNLATSNLMDCSDFVNLNITNAVCPARQCFSLVGKIQ